MRNTLDRLRRILRVYDPEPVEMLAAVMTLSMGAALLGPTSLFSSSNGFALLAGLLPENTWGFLFLALGILHLVVIARGILVQRKILATMSFVTFLFVASAVGSQNPWGFGSATFGSMTAACFWVCLRLAWTRR